MESVLEQLRQLRRQRHDSAEKTYSEILLRFDQPREGDARALDAAMIELHFDEHRLEHDVHLVQRYREYLEAAKQQGEAARAARKDAEIIRRGNRTLFLSIADQAKPSAKE